MVRHAVRLLVTLANVALLLAAPPLAGCGGAAREARACAGAGVCGADHCVVGRCRPVDALPSPIDAHRVLLAPVDMAVLSEGERGTAGRGVPEAVALGRAETGDVVLLLRFAAPFGDDTEIASAFLVLTPVAGAPPSERALTLEVARILEPWRSETATWGRQPRLSLPSTAAIARRRQLSPLRIDVTPLVRDWLKRRKSDHGIALLAPGDDAVGAAYSMGITQGAGPRLEVYTR